MRKNRNYTIFILIIIIIQVSLVCIVPSTTNSQNSSKNNVDYVNLEEKNIDRKLRENIHSSENPSNFTLAIDKSSVLVGLNFTLSWTISDGADNYSIYVSTKNITVIDGNSTLIKDGLINLNQSLLASKIGVAYYVAVAYNESGNTLSNSVKINILGHEGGNGDNHNGAMLSMPFIFFALIGIIILSITLSITGIISYKNRRTRASMPIIEASPYKVKEEIKKFEMITVKEVQGSKSIKNAIKIRNDLVNNDTLLELIDMEGELDKFELNLISEDYLNKVDSLKWEDEGQKVEFIFEMLTLTPEERDDIINYMIEKSNKNNIDI